MEPNPKSPAGWPYTEIVVHDGDRILKPTHICSTEITFREPPELLGAVISICIKTGERETRQTVQVLPHESGTTRIPIQLIQTKQNAPVKLIA